MKLKKPLLALSTAATVAVAGTTAAVAEEAPQPVAENTQDGNENSNENDPGKKDLAGSADKFFGWDSETSGLEKTKSVVTLITTIGALVAGIVTLATNFGKIEKLFK